MFVCNKRYCSNRSKRSSHLNLITRQYRSHGITEAMWRSGHALRPYFEDVRKIVQNKANYDDLNGFDIVNEGQLSFVHFPIKDCGITDDGRVLQLAKSLVQAISEGEVLYLHCWGGHGRTGTLVCIMLHLMYRVGDHSRCCDIPHKIFCL